MPGPAPRYAPELPLPAAPYRPGSGRPRPGPLPGAEATAGQGAAAQRFRYAVDLFNHGCWWEAHEAWEGLWHALPRDHPEALALRALILLAAAHLKWWSGSERGRTRHFERALDCLARARRGSGGEPGVTMLYGLALEAVARDFDRWREAGTAPWSREALLAAMPRLRLERGAAPP